MLTLTSGGCNALNLLLHGAGRVVAVDCNPAQSALLELKTVAIRLAPDSGVSYGCFQVSPRLLVVVLQVLRTSPFASKRPEQAALRCESGSCV